MRKPKRFGLDTFSRTLFSILFIAALLLAGCGAEQAAQQPAQPEAPKAEQPAETKEESRQVTHAMGTTEIKGTPQKVVTLYQGATDVAVAFGIKPVGVVESWTEKPIYEYLRDDLQGTQIVGQENQPNMEEIAKLKPDLIVASKLRHEKIYDQLSQIAPTVMEETVFDWKATVKLMGAALNQQEKADQLMADWEKRVAEFKEKMGDKLPVEVAVLNFRPDHARIYFTGFAGTILNELGFTRPENQQKDEWGVQLTSKESIPEMNADVFFIFNSNDPAEKEAVEKTFKEWTAHPLWQNLDAVKNGQVHVVDEVAWNMAGGYLAALNMLDDLYEIFGLQ
ncbi:MAG: iron-siderophore ABC transporter substrate-binding protein [Brevibacillus sp.]|nr:iron-siderophore ABC transporter substrate-binding protein [Brevibacillus sp.]